MRDHGSERVLFGFAGFKSQQLQHGPPIRIRRRNAETFEKRMDEISEWCKANKVTEATFIINGRKMPRVYIRSVKFYLWPCLKNWMIDAG